jgi:UDP:flavonoid glycosyltransferase YjiC (YdhE family)
MKVLFIAEAVTLAHVGRSIRLASILHHNGVEVELACDSRYRAFLAGLDFPIRSIQSIPTDTFLDALARGRPVFSREVLARYVEEDLLLLQSVRPDAVVGDFRLSLSVSARIAQVPYVNVTNAYWSPYARPRFQIPDIPVTRHIGLALAQPVFDLVRPIAFAAHILPMNRIRRAHGQPRFPLDVRELYCDGDLTLFADVPELIPTFGAPSNHRYIGAVLWSAPVATPAWWDEMVNGEAPIYVSLGSSGPAESLSSVVEALQSLGRPIVVATAGRNTLPRRLPGVWVADFVSGEAVARKACAVVCNGGSPTTQQAFAHGVPVVGIASNMDQFLNMDYVARFGAGLLVRADRLTPSVIREAVQRTIEDPELRKQARALSGYGAAAPAELMFPAALREFLGGEPHKDPVLELSR